MQKNKLKKSLSLIVSFVLIAAMALCMTACGGSQGGDEIPETSAAYVDPFTKGEGATAFTFEVVHSEGETVTYTVKTDKTIVGEALLDVGLIEGEVGDYGLYVQTVDGETAVFEEGGKYWAFYENDEYAQVGVDSTEIKPDVVYSFRVE